MEEVLGLILTGGNYLHELYFTSPCKFLMPTLPTMYNYEKTRFYLQSRQITLYAPVC